MIKKPIVNILNMSNAILVLMVFVGIFTYDRSIEFLNYSSLKYGLLLLGKFTGYFGALIIFYKISQTSNLSKLFVLSTVLFCQGGILFWIAGNNFIIKIIAYTIIGFSFNLARLTSINLLKIINAHKFLISIMSASNIISSLIATIVLETRILVILFISISTIMPYVLGNYNISIIKNNESNINFNVIVICLKYYSKFFWNIIFTYLGDVLFSMFFIQRLLLIGFDMYWAQIYFTSMMLTRLIFHYPIQLLLSRFHPNTKSAITSILVILLSLLHLIFYNNTYINFITNCGIGLFGSFFQFATEYLDKYKNIKHSFLPTSLVTNLIYGLVLIISVPIGTYINILSPKLGIDYMLLIINTICAINSII